MRYSVCYCDGELCGSGDLENSRGADEKSEPSSIPFHRTPRIVGCQLQRFLKAKPLLTEGLTGATKFGARLP
jgi:hypothetical protein